MFREKLDSELFVRLSARHLSVVNGLAKRLGVSASEVIRDLIDKAEGERIEAASEEIISEHYEIPTRQPVAKTKDDNPGNDVDSGFWGA